MKSSLVPSGTCLLSSSAPPGVLTEAEHQGELVSLLIQWLAHLLAHCSPLINIYIRDKLESKSSFSFLKAPYT